MPTRAPHTGRGRVTGIWQPGCDSRENHRGGPSARACRRARTDPGRLDPGIGR